MTSEAPSGHTCDCHTGFRDDNSRHPSWHFEQVLVHLGDRAAITTTSTSEAQSQSRFQRVGTRHRRGRDGMPGPHQWNTALPSHWKTAGWWHCRYTTTASSGHSSPTPPTPGDATHRNLVHSYRLAPRLSSTITSSIRQSATASAWHTDSPIQRAQAITSASGLHSKLIGLSKNSITFFYQTGLRLKPCRNDNPRSSRLHVLSRRPVV